MYLPDIATNYLKFLNRKEKYTAFSVDDYAVIEGKGYIDSNESWNYHNNYDDSEDTLHFTWNNGHCNMNSQKWWTLSKTEAEKECNKQIEEEIKGYQEKIDNLKKKIIK